MKVRATKAGFCGSLRKVGSVFEVPPHLFSANWMEKAEEPSADPEAPKPPSPSVIDEAARQVQADARTQGQVAEQRPAPKKRGRPKKGAGS